MASCTADSGPADNRFSGVASPQGTGAEGPHRGVKRRTDGSLCWAASATLVPEANTHNIVTASLGPCCVTRRAVAGACAAPAGSSP